MIIAIMPIRLVFSCGLQEFAEQLILIPIV